MKAILAACLLITIALAGGALWYSSRPLHFGPAFTGAPEPGIGKLLAEPASFTDREIRVAGRITRQCPSAGCWFYLDDGSGPQIKIELGAMGLKFPQHLGRPAIVEGRLLTSGKAPELIGTSVEFR